MKKDQAGFKAAFERSEKALSRRPSLGQKTGKTTIRLGEGFVCHIEDGPWKLKADWDTASGGNDEAPLPGVYGRAALGVCLAMGYAAWAGKLEVPLEILEVEVESDIDARATYDLIDEAPIKEIRYTVTVASSAPVEDIERVLDVAERCSPWHNVFAAPQNLKRRISVVAPQD